MMRKLRSKFGRNEVGICVLVSWLVVELRVLFKFYIRVDVYLELFLSLILFRFSGIDDNRKKFCFYKVYILG